MTERVEEFMRETSYEKKHEFIEKKKAKLLEEPEERRKKKT